MPVSQKVFSEWVGLDGYSYGNLMRVCKNPAQCGYLAMQDEYGWDGWLGVYFANLPNEKTTILMGMQKVDAGTFSMTRKIRNRIVSQAVKKIENSASPGNCCLPENTEKERMKEPFFLIPTRRNLVF